MATRNRSTHSKDRRGARAGAGHALPQLALDEFDIDQQSAYAAWRALPGRGFHGLIDSLFGLSEAATHVCAPWAPIARCAVEPKRVKRGDLVYIYSNPKWLRLWALSLCMAIPITFFFYTDQNLSSLLCQLTPMGLQRGRYFHATFLAMGSFCALGPMLGMPFVTASLPHSPQFVRALTSISLPASLQAFSQPSWRGWAGGKLNGRTP